MEPPVDKADAPGSSENPVVLRLPSDLERATRRVNRPSPAQAAADNYKMAHVIVCGLSVTIETPKDHVRFGTDPNGARWDVRMPADYGYIRGSRPDKDGDSVDVYLGAHSHIADQFPVWVVDQVHAHNGVFDEHKCLLGFSDTWQAYSTYCAGFSDNKGPQRCGALTRFTWSEFLLWLEKYPLNRPVSYHATNKSALGQSSYNPYGHSSPCQCERCRAADGGTMSGTAPASEPKVLGVMQSIWAKIMPKLSAEDRDTMLKEAALLSQSELGKGVEMLNQGDDHGRIGHVEDLWDGPPDNSLRVGGGHGPGSTAPPGSVNVGPSQQASGDGAPKMEREYSRHAPQGGVQTATEQLGRDIVGIRGAMKAFAKAIEGLQTQLEVLKGTAATPPPAVDAAMVAEAVNKAVAVRFDAMALAKARKAVAKAMRVTDVQIDKTLTDEQLIEAAKAEDKEDEKEEGSGPKVEVEIEDEEDDKDKPHFGKSEYQQAAQLRLQAKERVRKANQAIEKARILVQARRGEAAKAYRKLAKSHLTKAMVLASNGMVLRGGYAGPSTQAILKAIEKAREDRRGINPSQADNQDQWPASTEQSLGKGDPSAPATGKSEPAPVANQDLARAIDQITKAASGMGMLQASIGDLVRAVSGQAQPSVTNNDGSSGRLPPVFALAKAGGDAVKGVEMQLRQLHNDNIIDFDQFEASREVLNKARMNMPQDIVEVMVKRLPQAAQDVINRAA